MAGFRFNMKIVNVFFLFLFLPFLILISGCGSNGSPSLSPEKSTAPESLRIVSLAPNYTEILYALGAQSSLVGRSDFCDFPVEAKTIPSVGGLGTPNWERLIAARANLVLTTTFQDDRDERRLKEKQIQVYRRDIESIAGLYESITDVANLTGRSENGRKLVETLQTQANALKDSLKGGTDGDAPKLRVLILVGHQPLCTVGRNTYQADLVRFLGAVNVSDSLTRPYVNISPEQVVQWRPDVILYPAMNGSVFGPSIYSWPGWERVPAVKNRRVYCDLTADWLFRPGPRFVLGLQEIKKRVKNDFQQPGCNQSLTGQAQANRKEPPAP